MRTKRSAVTLDAFHLRIHSGYDLRRYGTALKINTSLKLQVKFVSQQIFRG